VTVVAGFVAGAVAGAALWLALRGMLAGEVFRRENHRGASLPTAAGLVVVAAVLAVEAAWLTLENLGVPAGEPAARRLALLAVVGFAFLGLVDDLAGSGDDGRGFKGHLRAMSEGRLTTGGLKLTGGAALSVVVVAPAADGRFSRLLLDALLVALSANLGNLFDRAPGRTVKVAVLATAGLVVGVGLAPVLAGVAVAVGAGVGVVAFDLRERMMLGDTGANALGGVLGLGVVLASAPTTRTIVLVVVAALNVASEVVSFSRVIAAVPPLRALDRLGRLP
jgi:UDP-N-acetylmuramyl pentapeptide phosphotransferase/UDP-N-acetylglucosamine-1-phosphate transferase